MTQEKILHAKYVLRERIKSLESDLQICQKGAFFPITMYVFSTIDYFSSLWAGWNDPRGENKRINYPQDSRNQTDRMADFLEKYLNYPQKSSKIAVAIFRHKLMHTAEPRIITPKGRKERYYWYIDLDFNKKHFIPNKVPPDPNDPGYDHYEFLISIPQIIEDLKEGILGPRGYFWDLISNDVLQNSFKNCSQEFENYEVEL